MPSTPAPRSLIRRLVGAAQHTACPCHGCRTGGTHSPILALQQMRKYARAGESLHIEKEYAFEIAAANLRFGPGATREVGMDFKNMHARKVAVFTDPNVVKLAPAKMAIASLEAQQLPFDLYDRVVAEPTEDSWWDAITWARQRDCSHFLAVGGGSVIDTAKAANLFSVHKDAELFDFLNAPVGKNSPVKTDLHPLIAVPTTAGTGSETTGSAIVDINSMSCKTGISNRALKPVLGIVDTLNTRTCPRELHISTGLDVLFHSMESYTAIPYTERTPRPSNPSLRPLYQGSNPVSDIFAMWALRTTVKHLPRIAKNVDDHQSVSQMMLAASFAGLGFGSAGCHMCHAISYPISGLNKKGPGYKHAGYKVDHPIIPHGISVALSAPAVFQFTAPLSPDRHREALAVFLGVPPTDASVTAIPDAAIGAHLSEAIASFLDKLGVPRGLSAVGYTKADIPALVNGTIPQRRLLDVAPGIGDTVGEDGRECLTNIVENAMQY